ncbi:hypothetical protein KOR42_37660 [Thalassoglobus neptunius]|uniref:Uncharacterized protein n=1 Tax=Thalassoglobus neptunius TaxID=1938619 RepID=A0A5C5WGP3_9PLAN|nr:hypothetical protein [Thalassoglobus neptunius]TWT49948.1 hypothetical protein KOR42_37660 [Thalassoglobus neptunius]
MMINSKKQTTTCAHRSRHGWTLVETLLIVTMTSTIGIVGAKLISRLISMGNQLQTQTQTEYTAQRFEDRLRTDVESSETAEPIDHGIQLFSPNGEAIQYVIRKDNSVRRVAPRPGGTAYETFQFPETTIAFEVQPDRVLFSCVPEKETDSFRHKVFDRPWTISTSLGRRNRPFSQTSESSEVSNENVSETVE